MFVGVPVRSSLRPDVAALRGLGAPDPSAHRLQLAVRVTANGKPLGVSTENLKEAAGGIGQFVEEGDYRATNGSCGLTARNQGLAVGGFLVLMEVAEIWSSDCGGGGTTRSESVNLQVLSGHLFPLQVGNRLVLRYQLLESTETGPEGFAQSKRTVDATYEVRERIADLRTPRGRSVGEVYVIHATENRRGKPHTFDIWYSTALGWRVGYKTDVTAELVDWR